MRIPEKPPPVSGLLTNMAPDTLPRMLPTMSGALSAEKYLHWTDLRFRKPPKDLSLEEWWLALKLARGTQRKVTTLLSVGGEPFWYCYPDVMQRQLHQVDQNLSGQIVMSEVVASASTRDRYLVSSLIEEATTSSQLEGASTTRQVAKEMIRSGRPPVDKSETMILNNYLAMKRVGELRDEKLTPELVLELHKIVSRGTLSSPDAEGRLQRPDEDRVEVWSVDGNLLHKPPPAAELAERLAAMCDFANGDANSAGFMHPVVRAIVLHFWLAYDHPFEDGNGRTARALFYWSMLSQKYWLAEFVTISNVLRSAPAKYARAFLYSETDDYDLTYFLIYNLTAILKAVESLQAYLQRKMEEIREAESFVRQTAGLNHRQLALLSHAMRHPGWLYTIESHKTSHRVSYQTARTDLLNLESVGYLERVKLGRALTFMPAPDLESRLRDGRGSGRGRTGRTKMRTRRRRRTGVVTPSA